MRVLFAAHQFFPEHYAGVEIVTLGLAKQLRARGHETFVLAPKRSIPGNNIEPGQIEDYEFEGVPVRRVGRPKEGLNRPYRLDYENEVMASRAREYMREVQPDVVHAEHFQGLSAAVIPAFKEFDVPLVYTATDFWTMCPVVDFRRHDGAMCRGPELAHCVRCIASRHTGTRMKAIADWTPGAAIRLAGALSSSPLAALSHQLRQIGALRERPGYIRERMRLVDRIIVYTRLMRELLLANGIGEDKKIVVSPYGIDTSRIAGLPRNTSEPPPLRVGFIGTLAPHKGCDILIRAFRMLPPEVEAELRVYGNLERFKPFVRHLRQLAAGDRRISFTGPFRREEVGEVLSGLDVLVVPSRWYENQPGVILEAFAARMPVVATDLGGMSEFVRHEENGLLFGLDDPADLARQLRRLYEEPGLLRRLREGIGPVKTVEEDAAELEALYESLLSGRERVV
ncbi:D-inositol-3-phosphate glycosyltransferase [Rubrobacter xylanophilus DSM 9941]|uniref:glycosyltransferase family 4 protein n=1 Tax=Rubrobacter xylanophilus TaxID=49319 RepID=UPI001C63EE53|nr:glycosyltransferase family 4 protein [Rubrobacter xylanophilus]QYJ16093.1 D-inositol-3-phosphate glycosyltransferase [Rubrobacter xylanophilus DSM 9941]